MTTHAEASSAAHDLRLAIGGLVRAVNARGGVPAGQLAALGVLDRDGPAATSELAARTRVRHQSMATTVRTLADRGLVASTPHPTDGRKTLLAITDAGRDLLDGERGRREDRLTHAIAELLSDDELRTLRAATPLLERLADHAREG
jgi:DNA-binding MarR family transcriptional regulator